MILKIILMKGLFDTHWLEDLVFDQEYKEPSPFEKSIFFKEFY